MGKSIREVQEDIAGQMEAEKKDEEDFKINREPDGRFKKGNSANPNGKGKNSVSLVATLKRALSIADKVIARLIEQGMAKNNLPAVRELFDRIDGKPTERHKVEGALPVKLVFVPAGEGMIELTPDEEEEDA